MQCILDEVKENLDVPGYEMLVRIISFSSYFSMDCFMSSIVQ